MAQPLFDRIQAALRPNARAATVAELIGVVETEIATATDERDAHHAVAVAVGSDDATADQAADAEARASRKITRLTGQLAELHARFDALKEAEARRAREAERRLILVERDELAAELRDKWDTLASELAALVGRISANDARCATINEASAEAEARGCSGNFFRHGAVLRRFTESVIPRLSTDDAFDACHWPLPGRNALSSLP